MENNQPKVTYDIYVRDEVRRRKVDRDEILAPMSYDKERFDRTDIGRECREHDARYNLYKNDPMGPDVLRYWAAQGLKKELFDDGGKTGFDAPHAYSVFTPVDMAPGKKYALIYFCHGGGQSIEWAEHYGFNALAASEKYMVVYAQNGGRSNNEVDTEFPRVMQEVIDRGYPVDRERIYVAGFSSGSEAAAAAACTCPEYAAAIAVMPGGQPFKDLPFCSGKAFYASTRGWRIPGIFIGGTLDKANFPAKWMTDYYGNGLGTGSVENAVKNLEIWMAEIARLRAPASLSREEITDLLLHSDDPVKREFGLNFDRSYTFRAQGTNWLGGDWYGTDGAPAMRMIRAEGVPHVVFTGQANIVWDYLKHFRRNAETGESIYDPIACWGER